MYSADYLRSLGNVPYPYSLGKPIKEDETKVKSKRRINIHEYRYNDGTTSIVIEGKEEISGLCERDIINLVKEALRNKDVDK